MRMLAALTICLGVLMSAPAHAQEPVIKWADYTSYGTALINPTIATYKVLRSDHKPCKLAQIGISELIGNGATLLIKHVVVSARPCIGCKPDGMPSGHSMNGAIGSWASKGWGISYSLITPTLRVEANRHTKTQAALGWLLGQAADQAGQKLLKCGG